MTLIKAITEFRTSIERTLCNYNASTRYVLPSLEDSDFRFATYSNAAALHNVKLSIDDRPVTRTLPMRRLDSLLPAVDGPMMLKVDVEAFELNSIDGTIQLLDSVKAATPESRMFSVAEGTAIFQ